MQKGTGTNEWTNLDTLDPNDLFSEMKTKRVLISKEQKQI